MTFQDYQIDVLAMLSRCNAPEDFGIAARSAQNVPDLRAVCYAFMAYIGQDLAVLADGFRQCGNPVEAARTLADAKLASEPWRIIRGVK